MTRLPLLLLLEGSTFVAASLVHRGFLVHGYEHGKAAAAETVIGAVLLAGAALAWARPSRAHALGLAAQGFALLGTAVGLFTIAVGVGPRTVPDVAYHAAIASVLVTGIVAVARRRPDALRRAGGAPRPRTPA